MGDDKEARQRDWAARFYTVGDEERAELNEGDVIEFIDPAAAMDKPQPLTSAQKKLDELEKRRRETVEAQDKIDRIGSQVVPTDQRAGELYQSPGDKYDIRKIRQERGRFRQSGKSLKYNVVMLSENPYSKANVYADGYGAMFELPVKLAKGINTFRRLNEITDYLKKRDNLLARVRSENRHVVPPKPRDVERLVKQVQRFGRITVNPYEKTQTFTTLQELERLREESNAFWKNRK